MNCKLDSTRRKAAPTGRCPRPRPPWPRALAALVAATVLPAAAAPGTPDWSGWRPAPAVDLSAARPLQEAVTIDFTSGAPACPDGAWSGTAIYVLPDRGRLLYRGFGFGCTTQRFGMISSIGGPTVVAYAGGVSTYLRGAGRPQADEMRPLVREGNGIGQPPGRYAQDHLVEADLKLAQDAVELVRALNTSPVPALTPGVVAFLDRAPAGADTRRAATPGATAAEVETATAAATAAAMAQAAQAAQGGQASRSGEPATPAAAEAAQRGAPADARPTTTAAQSATTASATPPERTDPAAAGSAPPEPQLLRAARDAAAARDPTRLPQPLLDARPELTALAQTLQRYGNVRMSAAPELEEGLLWGVDCDTDKDEDAFWQEPNFGETYRGQHADCLPVGRGRIRTAKGLEWIGEVSRIESTPMPNGLGELRLPDGRRLFVRAQDGSAVERFGWATPDGRFGVAEKDLRLQRSRPALSFSRNPEGNLGRIASEAGISAYFAIHNLDGTIVTTYMEPRTGKPAEFYGFSVTARHADRLRIPELGLHVEGEIDPLGGSRDRRAAAAGALVAGQSGSWVGMTKVTLERPLRRHPPGRYRVLAGTNVLPLVGNWRSLVGAALRPADADTLAALAQVPADCRWKAPEGELPIGWVLWTPGCFTNAVWAFDPEARLRLTFEFDAAGKLVRRLLEKDYGFSRTGGGRGLGRWESWEADRFEQDPRTLAITAVGRTLYAARWGMKVKTDPGSDSSVTETDYAGLGGAFYDGPLRGLLPDGVGQCSSTGRRGGDMEPCEYRNGERVDAVYAAQAKMGLLAAQQREAEQAQQAKAEKAAAAQRQRDQEIADAQEAAADKARKQQQADDDEASNRAILQAFADVKRSFAQGASEMAASNRQTENYLRQANQLAQQQARQQQIAQQNAARQADAQRAAKQNYQQAQQQAAAELAQARAEAAQKYRLEAAGQQAQRSALQRQAANPGGGTVSPYDHPGATASGRATGPGSVVASAGTTSPARQPDAVGTETRPWRVDVSGASEAEARSELERNIEQKWNCLALVQQTTRVIVDRDSISCHAFGITTKSWGCTATGRCERTGPGIGQPSKAGQGSSQ